MLENVSLGKTSEASLKSTTAARKETEEAPKTKKNGKAKLAAALIGLAAVGAAGVYAVKTGKVSALKDKIQPAISGFEQKAANVKDKIANSALKDKFQPLISDFEQKAASAKDSLHNKIGNVSLKEKASALKDKVQTTITDYKQKAVNAKKLESLQDKIANGLFEGKSP